MKKGFLGAGIFALIVMVSLLAYFQPGVASTNHGDELTATDVAAVESSQPIPLAGCAKIECGACPGPNCKIDGICCWVPGANGAPGHDGVASCGCTAQGEPVCKCDVGQPR